MEDEPYANRGPSGRKPSLCAVSASGSYVLRGRRVVAKVTLVEIVTKWERQLKELEIIKKGLEVHEKEATAQSVHYQRTVARIEMVTEHIRELQQYALEHAR
jgi:hypothetical protein